MWKLTVKEFFEKACIDTYTKIYVPEDDVFHTLDVSKTIVFHQIIHEWGDRHIDCISVDVFVPFGKNDHEPCLVVSLADY